MGDEANNYRFQNHLSFPLMRIIGGYHFSVKLIHEGDCQAFFIYVHVKRRTRLAVLK
jgi:hypothetical protein